MINIRQSTHREVVVSDEVCATGAVVQPTVEAPARRRMLLKSIGTGSAVVASLASRPAYAWHCQSPSAWGSAQINPNTSLKSNPGHASYVDETWTISNWADNSTRSATGVSSTPWNYLLGRYSGLKAACGNKSAKITIAMLCSHTGIQSPSGAVSTDYVRKVLSGGAGATDHVKYLLVAQLNYLLLSPLARNEIEKCMATSAELKSMANGSYSPPGGQPSWDMSQIKTYIYNNWIARP